MVSSSGGTVLSKNPLSSYLESQFTMLFYIFLPNFLLYVMIFVSESALKMPKIFVKSINISKNMNLFKISKICSKYLKFLIKLHF